MRFFEAVKLLIRLLATLFSRRVFLFAEPTHPNLGDQAQLMCTEWWIAETYPGRKIVKAGVLYRPFDDAVSTHIVGTAAIKLLLLRFFVKKSDLFIGHSGYFFVDHHDGWFTYYSLVKRFPNRFIILPQTVNFYTPVVRQMASQAFSNRENLTLLCRDEVSFTNAQELFRGKTNLRLYPDIVTSLIGTKKYTAKRSGILFIIRDDIERHYSENEVDSLRKRFGDIRTGCIDTTIDAKPEMMRKKRDELIWNCIGEIATYEVVITDRYHGTIFSAIASTPVVVINSADHKLSSGVRWFPEEHFGKMVQFAQTLDEAYKKANEVLSVPSRKDNPPYFKKEYWDRLSSFVV